MPASFGGAMRRALGTAVALGALAMSFSGCSRAFHRTQADEEARRMVLEKSQDPRWAIPDFSIEQDPRSRYYDPYDPDFPPMPPDDPASHVFMHRVHGMKGWKYWHRDGDLKELENPGWQYYLDQYAERTPEGAIRLRLEDAIQLALMHSPAYQQQLETLYLSALDVSTERFRFDVQFFGGGETAFQHLGAARGPGGRSSTTLERDTFFRARRQLATAGEILVGFANSMVWQFAGPDRFFTTSLLNFNLVQPLLRFGGRAVALEQLTIAERGLLANVRAFERYRQGFYTQVAIGDLGVAGPQRRGGFFGGTGLTGFTGQGTVGFGGVGEATGFGRGVFGADAGPGVGVTAGFVGGGAGLVGGFIGLLQQLQQNRNQQDALTAQIRTLALLEANLEAGLIDLAQVDQFRQNIESERALLLQAENSLLNSIENFNVFTLGLPPDLPVELDDTMIRQFQFIAPQVGNTQNAVAVFIERFGDLPREPEMEDLHAAIDELDLLRERIAAAFEMVYADLEELETRAAHRLQQMTDAERQAFAAARLRLFQSLEALHLQFEAGEEDLRALQDAVAPDTRAQVADRIVVVAADLLNTIGEVGLIQARARLEAVSIDAVELDPEEAVEIARAYRLDWMNNRAALVDTWRLIEFNANALRSGLDIVLSGDIQSVGTNPLDFRGQTGRVTASLQFDAPLQRIIERNNFRQQLINYQQARRQLIQFEDGIHRSLLQILRELEQLEVNLEIQRRAVAISIRRVDQTRETLARPVPPPLPGQPPAQFGPTAALNLLTALSDLRSSQNNLMSVWLNYHAVRLRLLRELGTMRIDERGMLIEEPLAEAIRVPAADWPLPPEVPPEWLHNGGPLFPGEEAPLAPPDPPPPLPEALREDHPQAPGRVRS